MTAVSPTLFYEKGRDMINQFCITDNAEENFKTKFNARYIGSFEYVSGYTGYMSQVKIRCLSCGDVFERCANNYKASLNNTPECKHCNDIKAYNDRIKKLAIKHKRSEDLKISRIQYKLKLNTVTKQRCQYCDEIFYKRIETKYCSRVCSLKGNNQRRDKVRYNTLRNNGKYEWSISIPKLIKRDKICKLCGLPVDINDIQNIKGTMIAGNDYPSIDHIIPISKGGTHTWDNVQLAHRKCNTLKSDTTDLKLLNNRIELHI